MTQNDNNKNFPKESEAEAVSFYYDEMVKSNLTELEIETAQGKIVLKRKQGDKDHALRVPHPLRRQTDFLPQTGEPAHPQAPAQVQAAQTVGKAISSPITGIFYRSPSPQSPAFVKDGDVVNAGATLCIVEAMKVMNEIKSDSRCKILKILVENGKSVTNGQPLFEVENA